MASTSLIAPPPPDDWSPPSDSSSTPPNPFALPPPPWPQDSSPPPPWPQDSSPPPPSPQDSSPPPPSQNSPPPPSWPNNDDDYDDRGSPRSPPSSKSKSPPSSSESPPLSKSSPPPVDVSSPTPTSGLSPPSSHSSARSRTHKTLSNSSSSSSSGNDTNLTTAIYVGVAVGAVTLLLVTVLLICCLTRDKKKKKSSASSYYVDEGRAPKAEQYYHSGGWQHGTPPPPTVKGGAGALPPPPGAWHPPPSPPPPVMNSSDMSSGNYSGPRPNPLPPPSPNIALGFNKSTFTYEELAQATNGFSQANLLGQGGFGYVHKGVLPNGKEIAVKQLKTGSGQGEREFQAEVEIISRVHHRHLVSLVGYCIAQNQRMLVYEFVANQTLEYHLHGKGRPTMDWPSRLRIALGSAKGLAYLHEDCHPRIIHRDIKAANILLDSKFEAQVADFGLAKLNEDTHTHVSTRVMGTFGYLAPEYASSGKLTEKSDVFSFGVMLLELVTGKKPVDPTGVEDSLVDWARPLLQKALQEGDYDDLVDPRLENNYNPQEMARLAACAAASVRHSARRRPKMSQIVRALEGDMSLESLNEGMKPGQSGVFGSSSDGSSEYDIGSYNADMSKFRKMAFATDVFDSTGYTATSEYGLHSSSSSSEYSQEIEPAGHRRNPSRH